MRRCLNKDLFDLILNQNIVSIDKLKPLYESAEEEKERLDTYLCKKGIITDNQQKDILRLYLKFSNTAIDTLGYDVSIVKCVTSEFVNKHNSIPLLKRTIYNKLYTTIAVTDLFDLETQNIYSSIFGSNCDYILTTKSKIDVIKNIVFSNEQISEAIKDYSEEEEPLKDKQNDLDTLAGADIQNAPAVRLADSILRGGIATGASDIHIEPYETFVRVRYRLDGVLFENSRFEQKLYPGVLTRFKILAGLNIAERRVPQDGRIKQNFNGIDFDFRVSTLPTVYGEKVVIRILDTTTFSFTRDKLGFLPLENKKIDELLAKPYGIILLTGPTGCGKSTTLYSFIKEVNNENVNVITVEDPVEYTIEGVNQVQVNVKADMTFGKALRSILRQDPNIVMIGEIRDEETAQIANRMAITGHLVFSTLHTNDAPGAVTRLIDLGLEPYFVTDALTGVIAQRLIRRLCPNCKKSYMSTLSENHILGIEKSKRLYKPVGCPACHNTGYKGRMGVHEVLVLDNELKELIMKRVSTDEIRKLAIKKGMLELKDTCKEAVLNGQTSFEELVALLFTKD